MTPAAVRDAMAYIAQKLPGREVKIKNTPSGDIEVGVWSLRLNTHICGTMPEASADAIPFAVELVETLLEAESEQGRTQAIH